MNEPMTPRLNHLVLLAALLCGGTISIAHAAPSNLSADQQSAIDTVTGYLDSLIAGDIPRIRGYLTPEFNSNRAVLLNRPDYLLNLQKTYANASYAILNLSQTDDGASDFWIDAMITLANGDTINVRFRLVAAGDHYLIMEEN